MEGLLKTLRNNYTLSKSPWHIKYGLPILLTIAITLVKLSLDNVIGAKTPFLLYFGAVIITSRYCARTAAVLVTALSAIAANIFFIPQFYGLNFNTGALWQTLIFILECLLITGLSHALTEAINAIGENELRFKMLIEKSSEGMVTINADGQITYCSPSIQNIIGFTDQEFLNLPPWILLHEDEALKVKEQFFRFASHPGKTAAMVHQIKHKNGSWIWIESKMTNLLDEPTISAIIANFTDITDRLQNEKLREDFISIASHELKTPLTSLKAYTQVLQNRFKNSADDTSHSIITKIEHQVGRVIQMINNLLDVTTLQQKKLSLNIIPFDLNQLVGEIAESIQTTARKHQLIIELAAVPQIEADRDRIGQVISNMISNAIKYSPEADSVHIFTSYNKGKVVFSTTDHGIGIPDTDVNKVFGRFYRVDEAKKQFQGLGLGLFICAEIIEQHGGEIGASSQKGKGSTFWFSLPVPGIPLS